MIILANAKRSGQQLSLPEHTITDVPQLQDGTVSGVKQKGNARCKSNGKECLGNGASNKTQILKIKAACIRIDEVYEAEKTLFFLLAVKKVVIYYYILLKLLLFYITYYISTGANQKITHETPECACLLQDKIIWNFNYDTCISWILVKPVVSRQQTKMMCNT